jgi:PilZ domain
MSSERRTEIREALVLPVLVGHGTRGVTRDISASGLFFETAHDQLVDDVLVLEFMLDSSNALFKFVAQGSVLRHERMGQKQGVAVKLLALRMEILA